MFSPVPVGEIRSRNELINARTNRSILIVVAAQTNPANYYLVDMLRACAQFVTGCYEVYWNKRVLNDMLSEDPYFKPKFFTDQTIRFDSINLN